MEKVKFIKRYGDAAYTKCLQQKREWDQRHPEKIRADSMERIRKGGKFYEKKLIYDHTGLQGERNRVRAKHGTRWRAYKQLIAPDSQIHHSWLPGTADYNGVALVEAEAHMQGVIKVIKILDGEIRLFTEKEIREQDPEQYAKVYI